MENNPVLAIVKIKMKPAFLLFKTGERNGRKAYPYAGEVLKSTNGKNFYL